MTVGGEITCKLLWCSSTYASGLEHVNLWGHK